LAGRLQTTSAMIALLTMCLLQAAPFEGKFRADQGVVVLTHQQGLVRGTMTLGSERVSLRGTVCNGVLAGHAIDGFRKKFAFRATLIDGVLSLTIETDTIDFTRETKTAKRPAQDRLRSS
jgi:hypothetical protein